MAERADSKYAVYMTEYEAVCLSAYATSSIEDAEEHLDQLDPEDQETTKSDIAAVRRVTERTKEVYEPENPEREARFWNKPDVLGQWMQHNAYTDFEGFASVGPVARLVRDALFRDSDPAAPILARTTYVEIDQQPGSYDTHKEVDATDLNAFIRDVLLHYCYETADQAGSEFLPTPTELGTAAHILSYVFNGTKRLMRVSEEDYTKALETYIDEEDAEA
jgi:hypothetical protein